MVNVDELSDEELVQQARAASEAKQDEDFRAAAGALLERYKKMITGCVRRRLSAWGAEHLFEDVAQEVNREILAQLQAPRLKPALRVMFKLTVNTTCRDVAEIALRHEGYQVPSRHAEPRVAQRPDAVPPGLRVSLNQPIDDEHDATTLEEVVADNRALTPDILTITHAERLERMRSLSPEQRMMVAVYGDYQERNLKADEIAVHRGLSVAEVKRYYTEACQILKNNKEH